MVHYISGSNVFGQWLCDDIILDDFRPFKATAKLMQINWSRNIFEADGIFYITGAWDGKEQQNFKIPLPEECASSYIELSVIANDYDILMIGKNINTLWVVDIKTFEMKKIQFHNEEPIEDPLEEIVKKRKIDNSIIKAEICNDSCIFLSSNGDVYCGILPSLVDTRHCKGRVIDVKCGYEHFVILTEEGSVYTWGNGRRLQLGHGDICDQEFPTEVDALAGVKIIKISVGGWHTLVLSEFGDLYAWGMNQVGQLGLLNQDLSEDKENSFAIPTLVDLFDGQGRVVETNIKDIACGTCHSAILLTDNTVWATGSNKYGQLGPLRDKVPFLDYFTKVFICDEDCSLMCGAWNTVIYTS